MLSFCNFTGSTPEAQGPIASFQAHAASRVLPAMEFSSRWFTAASTCGSVLLPNVRPDKIHDLLSWDTRLENLRHTSTLERGDILIRNNSSDYQEHVFHLFLAEQFTDAGKDGVMRSGEN